MLYRIRLVLAAPAAAALLTATLSLLGPVSVASAAPHDCTTTARAEDMIEEAEAAAGDAFGCINHCPCGKKLIWDGERWVRA